MYGTITCNTAYKLRLYFIYIFRYAYLFLAITPYCRSMVIAAIVLLPLLGSTWVIGLFAVNEDTTIFACIFAVLNSLQVAIILC